ncbi:MAG: hypothetical protein JST38_14030 [Bacteroidetes bacterium]|nr:hypothetical protein [Bacteroidota bacterium]MBS1941987.1 hypothetical protein [Bacteroidota bacterium]
MAATTDPIKPGAMPDRMHLEAYAQGGLTEAERHALERCAEEDPLVGEALEGLRQPTALDGLRQLPQRPPGMGLRWRFVPIALAAMAGGAALWILLRTDGRGTLHATAAANEREALSAPEPAAVESTLQVVHAELAAVPQEQLPARTATAAEHFQQDTAAPPAAERNSVARMPAKQPAMERTQQPAGNPHAAALATASRQLVFLHDLKLVRPEDLAALRPPRLQSPGLSADVDAGKPAPNDPFVGNRRYLDFMDGVTAALARGDNRTALDGLYRVLDQYPGDVNAQFYAGLACYRSGLYLRARHWFNAASANTVDSFAEEGRWYAALCTVQLEGLEAALPALDRIAAQGGFYAQQADVLLKSR